MNDVNLADDRVRFRSVETRDLEFVLALHNDLEIKTLSLGWRLPVSRDACLSWIESRIAATDEATWIVSNLQGDPLGVVRIIDLDTFSRRAEIGLYLAADARGLGVGKSCVQLATRWCFDFLGLHRVVARVLRRNSAALAVFETLGFVREGVLVEHEYRNGRYEDVVLLAVLEPRDQ